MIIYTSRLLLLCHRYSRPRFITENRDRKLRYKVLVERQAETVEPTNYLTWIGRMAVYSDSFKTSIGESYVKSYESWKCNFLKGDRCKPSETKQDRCYDWLTDICTPHVSRSLGGFVWGTSFRNSTNGDTGECTTILSSLIECDAL